MPRKRARYEKGRIRHWGNTESKDPKFIGFAGYKAAMTHVFYIHDQETSPFYGKELMKAVTVVETPPLFLMGLKVYIRDEYGINAIGEVFAPELKTQLSRKIQIPKPENYDFNAKIAALEKKMGTFKGQLEIRGLFHTQPWLTKVPKIKPEIIEIKVGGGKNHKVQFEFAKEKLGTEVRVRECVLEGGLVDTIGVSKGKGFQGVIKRYGVRKLPRKNRKGQRRVGCIGEWIPARVRYTQAGYGQMGYHQRVEYNKRVIKISEDPDEINPKGGITRYGLIKGDYCVLIGSVQGPKKRLIRFRDTLRPPKNFTANIPEITYISKESKQGK